MERIVVGGTVGGETRKEQMAAEHGGDVHEACARAPAHAALSTAARRVSRLLPSRAIRAGTQWRGLLSSQH